MRHLRIAAAILLGGFLAIVASFATAHAQAVKSVTVSCGASTLALGGRTTCSARVRLANGTFATNRPVAWGSSNTKVALVSDKGVVSTVAVGTAGIAATVANAKGEAAVTVTSNNPPPTPIAVASVSISPPSATLTVGGNVSATAITRDSSGNVLAGRAIAWTSLQPSIASVTSSGAITGLAQGSATIRATSETQHADAVVTVTAPVSPPDTSSIVTLPASLTINKPSVSRTITLSTVAALQAAIDSSKAGDKLQLTCGARLSGSIVLRGTTNRQLTSTCSLTPGVRVDSTYHLAAIVSPNAAPALMTAPGTRGWYVSGLEFTADSTVPAINGVVEIGDGAVSTNAQLPRAIVFDQTYIHSWPNQWVHRCVLLNADSVVFANNYVSECHADIDASAIGGWAMNGPIRIENNYLEASTENVAFGGADPPILNMVPSDISILRNHITKQLGWKGSRWLEKNLLEIKNARRVLIEGNVFENAWPHGQLGWAMVFWSVNQNGTCTWCITTDVTVRKNWIRNVAAGFQLTAKYETPSIPMQRVAITNNLFTHLTDPSVGDGGYTFLIQGADIPNLTIAHNTAINPSSVSWGWSAGGGPFTNLTITDNLTGGECSGRNNAVAIGQSFAATTTGTSTFTKNVVACFDDYLHRFTGTNYFPLSVAAIGFASDSVTLTNASPYHNAATDNTDIGANIAQVMAATAGVVIPPPGGRIRRP